ncbi:hypothetical protein DFH07DRAFT_776322 [Mycena maculata]|uniref:Uncharacterized protein n=1 Tax=Mycena maculata TaxID=230809 RepID=A0AAD7INI9_9AGAR|nr:hypothetical protein DFH07DRAFT_776322 [Mycena maculata]
MFYRRGFPNWSEYKRAGAPSKSEPARRCFIDEVFLIEPNTNDVLLICIESAVAPSKDERLRRCLYWELLQIRTITNDVILMRIKGAGTPIKSEPARRCLCGELFQIRTKTNDVPLSCIKGAGAASNGQVHIQMFLRRDFLEDPHLRKQWLGHFPDQAQSVRPKWPKPPSRRVQRAQGPQFQTFYSCLRLWIRLVTLELSNVSAAPGYSRTLAASEIKDFDFSSPPHPNARPPRLGELDTSSSTLLPSQLRTAHSSEVEAAHIQLSLQLAQIKIHSPSSRINPPPDEWCFTARGPKPFQATLMSTPSVISHIARKSKRDHFNGQDAVQMTTIPSRGTKDALSAAEGQNIRYCGIGSGYNDIIKGNPDELKFIAYYIKTQERQGRRRHHGPGSFTFRLKLM